MIINNFYPISLLSSISKVSTKMFSINCIHILLQMTYSTGAVRVSRAYFYRTRSYRTGCQNKYCSRRQKNIPIYGSLRGVPHNEFWNFLHKLQYYGIMGVTFDCFNNYVTFDNQYSVGRIRSQCIITQKYIMTGVHQGSNLCPSLFLIYINGLANVTKYSNLYYSWVTLMYSSNARW